MLDNQHLLWLNSSIQAFKRTKLFKHISSFQAFKRTKIVQRTSSPAWNQKFDFDEIGDGEYLKIRCYSEDTFSDDNIGSARVNLEGLVEGSIKDVWIPLEKVKSGELRFQIEAVKMDDNEGSRVCIYFFDPADIHLYIGLAIVILNLKAVYKFLLCFWRFYNS